MKDRTALQRNLGTNQAENLAAPLKDLKTLIRLLRTHAIDYAASEKRFTCHIKMDGELATTLLRYNWNNREVASAHTSKMLMDAKENRFPCMPEPIIFCVYTDTLEAFLWDGQTRCQTARLYGKGLEFNIDVIWMDRAQEALRRACEAEVRKRTLRDITAELKLPDVDLIDSVKLYLYPGIRRRGMISMGQLMQDCELVGDRIETAFKVFERSLNEEDRILFTSYRVGISVGMIHCIEQEPVQAVDFFTLFFNPSMLPNSHVVKVLRRELLLRKAMTNGRHHPLEIRAVVHAAFTWYASRLKWHEPVIDFVMDLAGVPSGGVVMGNELAAPPTNLEALPWLDKIGQDEVVREAA